MYVKKGKIREYIGSIEMANEYMRDGFDILDDEGNELSVEKIDNRFRKSTKKVTNKSSSSIEEKPKNKDVTSKG